MKAIYKTTSAVFIFLILFNFITCSSQTPALKEKSCPPCQIIASKTLSNKGTGKWPSINGGKALKINALTSLQYDRGASNLNLYYQDEFTPQGFEKFEFVIESWWMNPGLDPWSKEPYWGDEYLQPIHHFEECVDDNLRWMCGYSYIVDIPENYSKDKKYPLVIYLHGSVVSKTQSFVKRDTTRNIFYRPKSDPYVYAAPIKLEIDWDSKKLEDMIENIKENLNIDPERIYLTGLSMGGRGAFIIASELSNTFAAIMPLSPHHGPYSYLPLSKKS